MMSEYLKQIRFYGLALVIYVILNAAIWHLYTHQLFNPIYYVGDLARLSYLSEYAQPRQEQNTLHKRQIFYHKWKGETIDIVTIGDSFSSGGGLGTNNYYQDWLATLHNLNVMNLPKLPDKLSNIETAYILLYSGFLDARPPKALLLEDIGREVVKQHGRKIHPSQHWSIAQITSYYTSKPDTQIPSYSFLNSGNVKFLINQFLYLFDDNAIFSQVYKTKLKHAVFSQDTDNTLLFHAKDIENNSLIQDKSVALVTQNLNDLAALLAQKGIALYYMPVVDKLALYHDHIQSAKYPKSLLFDKLKKYPRTYHLIDTQAILGAALAEGEKDIFFLDDTHWTWKACKRIAEAFVFPPISDPSMVKQILSTKP
jgi:hypothetical protein